MLEAIRLLRKAHADDQVLLDIPRVKIRPGERVAVRGPSGSGKTLLLRALAWLDQLDGGELRFKGELISHDAVPSFRRRVVYLHQTAALDGATVEDAFKRPYRLRIHRGETYDRASAIQLCAELGRDDRYLQKSVRDLSGGEKQIAALIRALLLQPQMLLLDEPTAALDGATARRVEGLVSTWVEQAGDRRAVLWVSHDQGQTDRLATRALHVNEGRLREKE